MKKIVTAILLVGCICLLSASAEARQKEINSFWSCNKPDRISKRDPQFKRLDGKILRYNYATNMGEKPQSTCTCKYLGDGIFWTVNGVRQ